MKKIYKRLLLLLVLAVLIACPAVVSAAQEEDAYGYQYPRLPEGELEKHVQEVLDSFAAAGKDGEYDAYPGTTAYSKIYDTKILEYYSAYNKRDATNTAAGRITRVVDENLPDEYKALFVHDLLASTRAYDVNHQISDTHHASACLVDRLCVCQGYAEAYALIMNRLGVPCRIVCSNENNHAWNLVQINGNWYHVDVTWDDPLTNDHDHPGRALHKNFLVTDATMRANGHTGYDWEFEYESGSPSACGLANSYTFEGRFWNDTKYAVAFDGNIIYYASTSGDIKWTSVGSSSTYTEASRSSDIWPAGTGSYWTEKFRGIGIKDGRIYFNTSNAIYSYTINTSPSYATLESSFSSPNQIWGLYYDYENDRICYPVASSPYDSQYLYYLNRNQQAPLPAYPRPEVTNVYNKFQGMVVTWNKIFGVSNYRIVRSTNGGSFVTIGYSTGTTFTDKTAKAGNKYKYGVACQDANRNNTSHPGYYSSQVTRKSYPAPTAVSTVKAVSAGSEKIKLSWNRVNCDGYMIYRATSKTGKYTAIKDITSSYTLSYTNVTGLKAGKTYYYKVCAYYIYDGGKQYASSSIGSAKPIPLALKTVKAKNPSPTVIRVQWTPNDGGVDGYMIYRAPSKTGKYTAIANVTRGTASGYTDTGLKAGTKYYYKVRAYSLVSGKRIYDQSPFVIAYTCTKPGAPSTFTVKAATKGRVRVTWSAVKGADGYVVYRKLGKGGTYKAVKSLDAGTLAWTDTGKSAGNVYYYKVKAYSRIDGKRVYSDSWSAVRRVVAKY